MKNKIYISFILFLSIFILSYNQPKAYAAVTKDKEVTANPGDTSTELQWLLDYNKNGNYNLTIIIPEGTYNLKKELRIYSNTTINADSNAKLMKNHQKGAMLANDLSKDMGGYTTTENITIIGGIWDSSKIADKGKGTESFRFIHATNVTIKDATICNVPINSHLITFGGVKNGLIDNCTLYGYTGDSLKEAIQLDIVHDNVIVPSMQSDFIIYDDLPCEGITITNCEIYNYPRAIGSHTSIKGVFHKNIVISKNNIHNITEAAIKAYNYIDLEISNNTIKNVGIGALVYTYISNEEKHYLEALKTTKKQPLPTNYKIVIKNNSIHTVSKVKSGSTYSYGDGIRTIGNIARPLTGVTIENNTISGTQRYGMLLEGTPKCVITNNSISTTANSGLYLIKGCDFSKLIGNTLTKTGAAGSAAGGMGLSDSSDVIISDNFVTSPTKNGIFLYKKSTNCTITNNTITLAGDNAIAIYNQSNETLVNNNKINTYKKHGIYASNIDSATINANKIDGKTGYSSQDAIHISGRSKSISKIILKDNHVETANRYGIYIVNAPNSYIGSNTIINTLNLAIYLDKGSDGSNINYNSITNGQDSKTYTINSVVSKSNEVAIYKNELYIL